MPLLQAERTDVSTQIIQITSRKFFRRPPPEPKQRYPLDPQIPIGIVLKKVDVFWESNLMHDFHVRSDI